MKKRTLTIGDLLKKGLVNKSSEVKLDIENLRELHLVKPISKMKAIGILQLKEKGMVR